MPERFRAAATRAMWWAMNDARNHAREVGMGGRPGLVSRRGELGLRGSIVMAVDDRWPVLCGILGSNLVYARIHELGGTVKAVRAKYLRFRTQGRWVSKRQVTIPARPYLRPALEHAARQLAEAGYFLAAWEQVRA
ncbi:MAG: phage virion morphogenesis protein [Rhodocyclales bacterium]|nr:phage virion morphogenesis protein [Rhodocyclales bacterium]